MITQSESGLTADQYTALQAARGDPSLTVTIEQYTPVFTFHDPDGPAGAAVDCFDAIVCGTYLVRAAYTAADTLSVDILADEDGGPESWSSQNLTATSIVNTVPVSLAVSGNTVRVFWYDGTNIKYFESADNGQNWGAAQTVGAKASVIFLGAAALTRCHYITTTSLDNSRLGVALYSGSWSLTDSAIYWPFEPDCFDVVSGSPTDEGAASTSDILVLTTDFPPIISAKIQSTELVREMCQVQGLAFLRYQNAHYSSHWDFDVIDRAPSYPSRYGIRLSSYDDLFFATYFRLDGTSTYSHTSMALSRSKDGRFWELPYLLTANLDSPSILLKQSGYVYVLNAWKTYRSLSVGYNGDSRSVDDITIYPSHIAIKQGNIAQATLGIENPEEVLTIYETMSLQARLDLGYTVEGTDLEIQTFLGDVDIQGQSAQIPTNEISITARDYLARLMTVQADQVQEWDGHVLGGDNFEAGDDNTDYSGLRHTAIQDGSWKAPAGDDELVLFGSLSAGVAFNTYCIDTWNGECQAGFQVGASDTDDFAGLLFRAYDKDNFLCVKYDAESDTIKVYDRKNDVDAGLAESGAMSWAVQTWYWLKVRFLYSKVYVYSSTDGISWTEEIDLELDGVASGTTWSWTNFVNRFIPNLSGRMGYLGHGYSDYEDTYPDPPDPLPETSDPPGAGDLGGDQWIFGTMGDGVFYTDDIEAANPAYFEMNNGLGATGSYAIYDLKIMQWTDGHNTLFAGTRCGIYEYENLPPPAGAWTKRITSAQIATAAALGSYTHMYITDLHFSIEHEGWCWAYFNTWYQSGINQYRRNSGVVTSHDGFKTIHDVTLLSSINGWLYTASIWGKVCSAQHGDGLVVYATECYYNGAYAARIHKSVDGGSNFSLVESIVPGGARPTGVWVPYHSEEHDDSIVYWGYDNVIRRSTNSGASFSAYTTAGAGGTNWLLRLSGPTYNKNIVSIPLRNKLYECVNGTTTEFEPDYAWGSDPDESGVAYGSFVMRRLYDLTVDRWLWAGAEGDSPYAAKILINEDGARTVKTGDFNSVASGTSNSGIYSIARWEYESLEVHP